MGKEEVLSWGCTRVEKEQGCLLRRPWFSIYVRPPDWPYFLHHNIYSRNIFCCSWFSRLDCSILSIWADEFSLQNPRTIIIKWLHVPISFVIVIFPFFLLFSFGMAHSFVDSISDVDVISDAEVSKLTFFIPLILY